VAQTALPAPHPATTRRRVVFGLFSADGWPWATVKALFWFVVLIVMLGYIPDRAYYFTVQRTVDVGLLAWTPINLCPPANEGVPCPAPAGATLPWHPGPAELSLPAPRTDGAAGVIGRTYVYAGGSDGTAPSADVWFSHVVGSGNIDVWAAGPSLPEARSDAAVVVSGSTLYVIGGLGPDGQPTDTVYSVTVANDGTLAEWVVQEGVLPAPRAGASAVAVSDGLVVMGGTDGTAPTRSVYKTVLDGAKVAKWADQAPLYEANMDGIAVHVGDVIFLAGGLDQDLKPVATVQQGLVGGDTASAEDPNAITAMWRASAQTNLPEARSGMSGFTANGVIYVQGGSDAAGPRAETWWAVPDAEGVIPAWQHLAATDLGEGLTGSSAVVNGANAFLLGGTTAAGPTAGVARASLAPQEPFFQLGILGAVVPALQLEGEIGQQIGYLNAAGAGTVNFVILILIGYLYNHPEKVRSFMANRRRRKG
jgi:N-acetylneuraminic acid mutarotase